MLTSLAVRLLNLQDPEQLWTVQAGDRGECTLRFHGSRPAYEVVVLDAGARSKVLPLLRIAYMPPRGGTRIPALPRAAGGPWLQLSWRDRPRGGPGRGRRTRRMLVSADAPSRATDAA